MAAGIIDAVCTYVSANAYNGAGCTVWDGEVHRYDANKQSVSPDSSGGRSDWPVIKFSMPVKGFHRNHTFEEAYHDEGQLVCQIWHTTREQAEQTMDMVETLLATIDAWKAIGALIPSPYQNNPHYVIQLLLEEWSSYQVEGFRTQKSELVYTCELHYKTFIHGAVPVALQQFSPIQLGPSLWIKGDAGVFTDAGATPPTSGQTLQQWVDQGSGIVLTQNSSGNRPTWNANQLNGLPTVAADGATSWMNGGNTLNITGPFSAFFVASCASANNLNLFSRSDGTANAQYEVGSGNSTGSLEISSNVGGTFQRKDSNTAFAIATTAYQRRGMLVDPGNNVAWYFGNAADGTPTWSPTGVMNSQVQNFTLFCRNAASPGNFFHGSLGELVIVSRLLTASEVANMNNYLFNRWGV